VRRLVVERETIPFALVVKRETISSIPGVTAMLALGMIKHVDGTPPTKEQFPENIVCTAPRKAP